MKSIHRGVKECEKAIKKCPLKSANPGSTDVPGLVIIAGDISPMDVIMHFPILCEEHNVPYLFVKSRADLGVAACTKRATSVVMLKPEGKKPAAGSKKEEDADMAGTGEDKKVSATTAIAVKSSRPWMQPSTASRPAGKPSPARCASAHPSVLAACKSPRASAASCSNTTTYK